MKPKAAITAVSLAALLGLITFNVCSGTCQSAPDFPEVPNGLRRMLQTLKIGDASLSQCETAVLACWNATCRGAEA